MQKQQGFSILEVLMALSLFGSVSIGLLHQQTQIVFLIAKHQQAAQEQILAENADEEALKII